VRKEGRKKTRKRTENSLNLTARSSVVAHGHDKRRLDTLNCSTTIPSASTHDLHSHIDTKNSKKDDGPAPMIAFAPVPPPKTT
jgi:hypothetical protein